ncbi:MAG: SUMF1/EgtB/PvdO family nonheme iron enzyme [Alphaproteobacteria bacterium]|nr:SUMF1/EgtB/PvdO family nonheme iron enzyme [Alphaproteobacteria bacterium]
MIPPSIQDQLRALARLHGLDEQAVSDVEALLAATLEESYDLSHDTDFNTVIRGTIIEADPVSLVVGDSLPPVDAPADDPSMATLDFDKLDQLPPPEPRAPGRMLGRYEERGVIGRGGMGLVLRVRDGNLNRSMAAKVLRREAIPDEETVARFLEEAQVTAQLDHPGVVPVHELGRLPDGRHYFTMKEVRGRTLDLVIAEVHEAITGDPYAVSASGWTFRSLIDAFLRVAETVAYAHSLDVVHRDLKPRNIMVGSYGAVHVLDWGLAKVLGRTDRVAAAAMASPEQDPIELVGSGSVRERVGRVAGTPMYMPPEQAKGRIDLLGPTADVYALGAVLYEILSGKPPFNARNLTEILSMVVEGAWVPLDGLLTVPEELREICERAMALKPEDRYPHAGAMAAELRAWAEGAGRRERALGIVDDADALLPEIDALRQRAEKLSGEAEAILSRLRSSDPVSRKQSGWGKQDEAEHLLEQARRTELAYTRTLHAALNHVPDLPEALYRLARHYERKLTEAEARGDAEEADRLQSLLQDYNPGGYEAFLEGWGSLSISVDAPGAEVKLSRYVLRGRRLTPEPLPEPVELEDGRIDQLPLRMGSYLVELSAPGRLPARYPVRIRRGRRWDGAPPKGEPQPIPLLREGALGPDDVYVPGGWFQAGGDPKATNSLPRRDLWVDGFILQRFPVTNADYIRFLDDLVDRGMLDYALACAPRERGGTVGGLEGIIYGRDEDGHFVLRPDADGDLWGPDWPVLMVDWFGAMSYARWEAGRTGRPWRLPMDLEWEKAARGVDGRCYPWGDFLDPTWARIRGSQRGRPLPGSITDHPEDVSPYGVRGLAGNARDWCLDAFQEEPPADRARVEVGSTALGLDEQPRVLRGGAWFVTADSARAAFRASAQPRFRLDLVGFRLARSLTPEDT